MDSRNYESKQVDDSELEQITFDKEEIAKLNKRDCYNETANYIRKSHGTSGRIVCLHGLRRTGKTTLMKQLSLEFGGNIFQVKENQTMKNVLEKIKEERNKGEKIVFVDEITFAKDFISNSALLADLYAGDGIDIVVAGTDSLGLQLAKNEQLFDRTYDVEMTYISFAEHSRVLNTANFDEYIKFGGLMTKGLDDNEGVYDEKTAKTFLDSAVAGNIARTLSKASHLPNYVEIKRYSEADLQKCIKKVVELYNGAFNEFLMNDEPKTMMGAPISDYLKKIKQGDFPEEYKSKFQIIDRDELVKTYKEKINLSENLERPATEALVNELTDALIELEILSAIPTRRFRDLDGVLEKSSSMEYYINPPAIKYWMYTNAKEIYMKNQTGNIDDDVRELLSQQLQNDIFGRVMESTIIHQTAKTLGTENYLVVKPFFFKGKESLGEYDMLVWDKKNKCHWAFEIKHATKPFLGDNEDMTNGQDKNLLKSNLAKLIENTYGERKANIVLYNGEPFVSQKNTVYLNAASYLKTLDKNRVMEQTIAELMPLNQKTIASTEAKIADAPIKQPKRKPRDSGWER